MLLHRRDDFLDGDWPPEMAAEAIRLKDQVDHAIGDIARRLFGRADPEALQLIIFAIIDVPLAAVRRHVANNEMPPPSIDDLIVRTCAALISPSRGRGGREKPRR